MNQEHQPYHVTTLSLGANTSDDKEFVGSKESSGEYIEGRNQRPTSTSGNTGASNKIKGESLLYPSNAVGAYSCIGAISVNENIVEFWASTNPADVPLVRVNGVVTLKSLNFPITIDNPLQLDKNEDEVGGEVFATDYNVDPFILNVQDMLDSLVSNPTKYFADFDFKLYSVNLFSPLDMPVYVETVNVGGGAGLPVGNYSYQLRYSNNDGDRTNISQRTPLIPIVQNLSNESAYYPGVKTYGQDPNPNFGTRYGIRLRFRCTNLQGYDFIEIIRTAYNTNGGIDFVPSPTVVAKIDIFNNEISVKEFVDPAESNTSIKLSDEEVTQEITYINAAKAIRYFDRRTVLMNVELSSKDSQLTFKDVNGKVMFPVIDNLGKIGYNDPYNFVYKKHYMHGERYGWGVELYDGVGGKGFVTKVTGFTNYQIPNRREQISNETNTYSFRGTVRTTDIFNQVVQTHEVFDHYSAVAKSDKCSFKNIYHNKVASFILGTKLVTTVKQDCDETNGEVESHGAKIYTLVNVSPYYHPFSPTAANDPNTSGHNYVVNTKVCTYMANVIPDLQPADNSRVDQYSPKIFGPTYYAQGMCLAGVDNLPIWAKAFSVVRTEPAKRVVAQGIGMYKLKPADFDLITNKKLTTKELDQFWFFSPDIENGIVSGKLIDDIIASPESYQLQFVSPLGFASEVYSFDANNILQLRDRCVDIIAYARMMRDNRADWEINPLEDTSMGFPNADGYNYVGYARWRNTTSQTGRFAGSDGGNVVIDILSVERVSEGRGTYMSIRTSGPVYGNGSTGGTTNADFEDQGMKNFTEPFYIVNIISNGASVRNQNVENYKITSHYQKLESIIGKGNGLAGQKYQLVDERWEDVIPALYPAHSTAATDRYIYIKKAGTNTYEKWMNVTFKTPGQISTIIATIMASGSFGPGVTGLYRHENIGDRFFNIVFNVSTFFPAVDDLIVVRYDNTAPIRFFGGDAVIGESIFAPIDREASANGEGVIPSITAPLAPESQFPFGIGFPYRLWKINPRYYQIKRTRATTGGIANVIQDREWGYLGYIRQMCVMFTVESRIATPYAHNNPYPLQFFPLIHYVIRPLRWDDDRSIVDNNIYSDYVTDYGEQEKAFWKYGGFRFIQQTNPDYATTPPKEFVSKPEFGFVEKTKFRTRVMWSLPRQLNKQASPGLKTFPANNSYDINDNQGEIKRAWEATTDKGENLYAITNSGVCLLVTKKSILSDLDAGELAYMSAKTFVQNQYWLNKSVGMNDEFWRSAAEGFVPVTLQDESEVLVEALYFANKESVYRLMDNQVKDIGRINYHNTLYLKVLSKVLPGYQTKITGVYDKYNQEYWLNSSVLDGSLVSRTHVFGQKNGRWYGYYDYNFDKFTTVGNDTYGMRNMQTYKLGTGFIINGANIVYEATIAVSPKQFVDKEFIRVRVNTGDEIKPTRIEFYDKFEGTLLCALDQTVQGPLYLKKYRGWEQFIPRATAGSRNRVQGRLLVTKIVHNLPEDFRVIDIGTMYKVLK